ncbi:MAG: ATP-binding protein, partial [Bacteroidota bacterium]
AKELVAFANADGGELFIGIEDNNQVTGVPQSEEKLLSDIVRNCFNIPCALVTWRAFKSTFELSVVAFSKFNRYLYSFL